MQENTLSSWEDFQDAASKLYEIRAKAKERDEGYVSDSTNGFSIPAKNLDADSSYEVMAIATGGGKSVSDSVIVNIPAKGNK